jgi:hypothetical protein
MNLPFEVAKTLRMTGSTAVRRLPQLKSPEHTFFQLSPARQVIVAWSHEAPATQLPFVAAHDVPIAATGWQVPPWQ